MQVLAVSRKNVFPLTSGPTHHNHLFLLKRRHHSLLLWINYLVWHCVWRKKIEEVLSVSCYMNLGTRCGPAVDWRSGALSTETLSLLCRWPFSVSIAKHRETLTIKTTIWRKKKKWEYLAVKICWIYQACLQQCSLNIFGWCMTYSPLFIFVVLYFMQKLLVSRVGCRELKSPKKMCKHTFNLDFWPLEDHLFWKSKTSWSGNTAIIPYPYSCVSNTLPSYNKAMDKEHNYFSYSEMNYWMDNALMFRTATLHKTLRWANQCTCKEIHTRLQCYNALKPARFCLDKKVMTSC
jgi:hypothetical protein